MSKSLEKILIGVIRWGSFLILFLPLLVFRKTLYPYIFPKIIAFQILVEIIFAAWLILIIKEEKYRPNFKHPLVLTLTIFIAVLFLTMILGVDISKSFFSTQERMTGVLTMFHFYGWFLVLTSCFKKWKDWRKFIWISLGVSFLVGLYGIGQTLGFEFLMKGMGKRMSSTLGNPIYLSVFSMLHVFLAGFLFFIERKKILKVILFILLLFNLAIMPLGASRAVVGSFVLCVPLFLLFLVFVLPSKKLKIGVLILLILIVGSGIFLFQNRRADWLETDIYFVNRLLRSRFERSLWKRTEAWKIAFKGFKEKPITGWGWENYNIVFNKHFNPRYSEIGNRWYDKSHNQVMDILALTGILGSFSYFLLFFFILFLLFWKVRKENALNKKIGLGILGVMFISYFLQNLFVFDTPAPLIAFYFSLSLIYFVTESKKREKREEKYFQEGDLNNVLILLILIGLCFSVYNFNVKPALKSHFAFRGAVVSEINLKKGLGFYKKSLAAPSFTNPEVRLQLGKSVLEARNRGNTDPEILKLGFQFAVSEMKKSIEEHPLDVRHYLNIGKVCNNASNFDMRFLETAEKFLEQGKPFSPSRSEIYRQLGWAKLLQEKNKEAIEAFKKAVELNKNISESHWFLGLALLNNENYKEGIKEVETAQKMGHSLGKDPNIILFIAQAYSRLSNLKKAISLCDEVLKIEPENNKALSQKVLFLIRADKKSEAVSVIEKLSEINPETAEKLRTILENF